MKTINFELPSDKELLYGICNILKERIQDFSEVHNRIAEQISKSELEDRNTIYPIRISSASRHAELLYISGGTTVEKAKEDLEKYKAMYKFYKELHDAVINETKSAYQMTDFIKKQQ